MENKKNVAVESATNSENNVEVIATFKAPETLNSEFTRMTIGEVLDNLDTGAWAYPIFQRGFVWKQSQIDLLGDSILVSGIPLPAIIVAKVAQGDEELNLVIDGLQRTTAIRKVIEGIDVNNPYEADSLDFLLGAPIDVQIINCENDVSKAAELFKRYNNGVALSGIQRNKANLPADILGALSPYLDGFKKVYGSDTKIGKATSDTVAMFLAACLTDPQKAATSSATASKILLSCDAKEIAPYPAELVKAYADMVENLPEDSYTDKAFWNTSARMIPAIMAGVAKKVSPDEFTKKLLAVDYFDNNEKCRISTVQGVKNPVTKTSTEKMRSIMSDTGNGHKPTDKRFQAFINVLSRAIEDTAETTDNGQADLLAQINNALGIEG